MFLFLDILALSLLHSLQSYSALGILTGIADLFGGAVLLIIGILVIVLLLSVALVLLPAIIIAVIVWFLTGSFFYAGIAFLVVALISLVAL